MVKTVGTVGALQPVKVGQGAGLQMACSMLVMDRMMAMTTMPVAGVAVIAFHAMHQGMGEVAVRTTNVVGELMRGIEVTVGQMQCRPARHRWLPSWPAASAIAATLAAPLGCWHRQQRSAVNSSCSGFMTDLLLDGDAFGQVAWLIDITALALGDMVGVALQRQDRQQRLQQLIAGHFDREHMIGEVGEFRVIGAATVMIRPPRARTSSMFDNIFSRMWSGGQMQTTGSFGVTRAIGPCLNSPAA